MKDIGFRKKELETWTSTFPRAMVMRFEDAGHFLGGEAGRTCCSDPGSDPGVTAGRILPPLPWKTPGKSPALKRIRSSGESGAGAGLARQYPGPDHFPGQNGFITRHDNVRFAGNHEIIQRAGFFKMSPEKLSSVIPVMVFFAVLFIILPVNAENVTANQTTVAVNTTTIATSQTTVAANTTTVTSSPTTAVPTGTTPATSPATATPIATTVTTSPPATVVTTINPTLSPEETKTTGSMMIYSSPAGAMILIDGAYSGTTPKTLNGMSVGNHILRLEMSGYYNYEGSIYVVPGQTAEGYGTLQPMNQVTSGASAVVPVIIPVSTPTPQPTQDPGLLGNPSVIIAIIGAVTVIIAAGTSVFVHLKSTKKE
jgi:hypothetical protein